MRHLVLVIVKQVDSLKLQGVCHKMKGVTDRQVARNMWRFINILRNKHAKKNCAPIRLYLQDHTGMHDQQNVQFDIRIQFP